MLQDRLEEFFDVNVGSASRIDSEYLVEEKYDCLIIGDMISEAIPSLEIQNWLLKFKEISNKNNLVINVFSGFYIAPYDFNNEQFWIEFLKEHINTEMIFPPVLSLKLKKADLILENGSLELVKAYSNDIIGFLIKS
ncbi:MAG: hypothetical protein ACFFDN_24505 [Candidatus Hodarchaeota archaeon]